MSYGATSLTALVCHLQLHIILALSLSQNRFLKPALVDVYASFNDRVPKPLFDFTSAFASPLSWRANNKGPIDVTDLSIMQYSEG